MARWHGTTTERGYGHQHQAERKRRLARWRPGDPCARCGRPMYGPPALIDLGHTTDRTAYTGLEHRHCNRGEGARRGNRMRGRVRAWQSSRRW
jgi:hypothetical protein